MTDIKRGLADVVVDTMRISRVNPDTNSLLYRGYPVQELAARCSMEQVAYLLWHGELPSPEQLTEFEADERTNRVMPDAVRRVIDTLPTSAHPMDVLRTAVSVLGALDPNVADAGRAATLDRATRLFAVLPAIVAYDQRRRRGEALVPPRDDLDYARNFLWMTFGELSGDVQADVFRIAMVLYAEHSFTASTFTARVVTSTRSDLYSAVVAAIGALKGPLHGAASEAVMGVFDEIANPDAVDEWLDTALAEQRTIAGFGHGVDTHGDSRVPTMKTALDWLIAACEAHGMAALYDRLETAMRDRTQIEPNVDYPGGAAFALLGFDTWMFAPLFVASRVTGWSAHIMEQRAADTLIRPLSEYVGPAERHVPESAGPLALGAHR